MNVMDSIRGTIQKEAEELVYIKSTLDKGQTEAVLQAILKCKGKVIISGCGTTAMTARKIVHTLCCVNCPALFLVPSDAVHGGLGVVQKEDVVILLSKGGETGEINGMIESVQTKGALLIAVTEKEESEIAQRCDLLLRIKVREEPDDFNMLATSSALAVIAVFDAIAIVISRLQGYTREEFVTIHPGGNVGNRLKNKEA